MAGCTSFIPIAEEADNDQVACLLEWANVLFYDNSDYLQLLQDSDACQQVITTQAAAGFEDECADEDMLEACRQDIARLFERYVAL